MLRSIPAWLMIIACAAGATPPTGRPPVGPLQRYDPKIYDFNFRVTLKAAQTLSDFRNEPHYDLVNTPIIMPIIHMGTFHRVNADSAGGKIWLDNREINPRCELRTTAPFGQTMATMRIDKFQGKEIRWQVGYSVQTWSSRINDEEAARIPWPSEWPKEVLDGLQPQTYIDSTDRIFKQAVEHVTGGKLKSLPPYLAAKELVRYCLNEIQVHADGIDRGAFGIVMGMEMWGAARTAHEKRGTPIDLVNVCVATLRAAGIPARPVIGAMEYGGDPTHPNTLTTFVVWAEFYLPEAGWVPFDPIAMRGKGIRSMDLNRPWPEFGTMEDLNLRIPLSHHYIPPLSVQTPRSPGVWGWDPNPGPDVTAVYQIQMSIASRGRGVED